MLADDDDSTVVLPRVIAAATIVVFVAAAAIIFGILNANKQPVAPVASNLPPTAPTKEVFTESRASTVQRSNVASFTPPPPRVFLPPGAETATDPYRMTVINPGVLGSKPGLAAPANLPSFRISTAKLTNSRKPDGTMVCYGSLRVVNRSIDNIVDFDIYLVRGKKKYLVKPFTGTLDDMDPLPTHVVLAREALTMPVVVDNYVGPAGAVDGRITLVATLDSTPKLLYLDAVLGRGSSEQPTGKKRKL